MATYFHKLRIRCACCGAVKELFDSREFDEEDDLFMYTSGTCNATFFCEGCGTEIYFCADRYPPELVEICEAEKYFAFLERALPSALHHSYSAPDRSSWEYGKIDTVDWYKKIVDRLCRFFPEREDLRQYQKQIEQFRRRGKL